MPNFICCVGASSAASSIRQRRGVELSLAGMHCDDEEGLIPRFLYSGVLRHRACARDHSGPVALRHAPHFAVWTVGRITESIQLSASPSSMFLKSHQCSVCSAVSPGCRFRNGPRVSSSSECASVYISKLQPKSGYLAPVSTLVFFTNKWPFRK